MQNKNKTSSKNASPLADWKSVLSFEILMSALITAFSVGLVWASVTNDLQAAQEDISLLQESAGKRDTALAEIQRDLAVVVSRQQIESSQTNMILTILREDRR